MESEEDRKQANKDVTYREYYDKMQGDYLKTLVCDEVIEEYKHNPLGQHSEPLSRLLHFFSCAPQKGKYALKREEQTKTFKIIALSGERGEPPQYIDNEEYGTLNDAYHGVFLKRIHDLMES